MQNNAIQCIVNNCFLFLFSESWYSIICLHFIKKTRKRFKLWRVWKSAKKSNTKYKREKMKIFHIRWKQRERFFCKVWWLHLTKMFAKLQFVFQVFIEKEFLMLPHTIHQLFPVSFCAEILNFDILQKHQPPILYKHVIWF